MRRELFGTDGVRGRANRHPMTPEVCLALGRSVALSLREAGVGRPTVVIGRDTRRSGPMLESALTAGLQSAGADVVGLGVIPTPGVAFLCRELRAHAGLVISASHNPHWDNGVKVFRGDGFKLSDAEESALEAQVLDPGLGERAAVSAGVIGTGRRLDDAVGRYVTALKASFPGGDDLSGLRVVLDCAHGACYQVGPIVFEELGAEIVTVGVAPDGLNINDGVGATAPAAAADLVRAGRGDLGVTFDGDGDRVIFVDERGEVVDGDEVLAIGAVALQARGALAGGAIVATVMSNVGLEVALEAHEIGLIRSAVGDRYVVESMRENGCNFGGEQSGHVVNLASGTTGDGIATALLLLAELKRSGRPLSALRSVMTRFPQTLVNIPVARKPALETLPPVTAVVAEAEQSLGPRGRVLVRYSGTEPKARVMVEGEDSASVSGWAERIAAALVQAVGAPEAGGER